LNTLNDVDKKDMKSLKINKEDALVCSKWKRLTGVLRGKTSK